MSSWTQVYVSGIRQDLIERELNNNEHDDGAPLEEQFKVQFHLDTCSDKSNEAFHWAGEGTSTFKRHAPSKKSGNTPISDDQEPNNQQQKQPLLHSSGFGYGFLSFLSQRGAAAAVEVIDGANCNLGNLRAELSQPNKNAKKKQGIANGNADVRDLRLRRKRAPPAAKHPVKTSSNVAKLYRG